MTIAREMSLMDSFMGNSLMGPKPRFLFDLLVDTAVCVHEGDCFHVVQKYIVAASFPFVIGSVCLVLCAELERVVLVSAVNYKDLEHFEPLGVLC